MAQMPKTPTRPKKLVWRISADAPKGEWVDPDQIEPAPPKLVEPEVSTGSWVTSSFDLLSGADVEVRKAIRSVAQLEDAPFESAAAKRLRGDLSAAEFEAAAKGETGRSNDLEWIEALVATVEGDAARAEKHRRRAAELSDPPGEHPGLLLCVGLRK